MSVDIDGNEVLRLLFVGGGLTAIVDLVRRWRADRDTEESRDVDLARTVRAIAHEELEHQREETARAVKRADDAWKKAEEASDKASRLQIAVNVQAAWIHDVIERWAYWRTQDEPPRPPD